MLLIRGTSEKLVQNQEQSTKRETTNCCCFKTGVVSLKTEFEKNIYCPNEVAKAIVTVDNSMTSTDARTISFGVVSTMRIKIGKELYIDITSLANQTKQGPKAKEKMEEPMSVDLSKIRV